MIVISLLQEFNGYDYKHVHRSHRANSARAYLNFLDLKPSPQTAYPSRDILCESPFFAALALTVIRRRINGNFRHNRTTIVGAHSIRYNLRPMAVRTIRVTRDGTLTM